MIRSSRCSRRRNSKLDTALWIHGHCWKVRVSSFLHVLYTSNGCHQILTQWTLFHIEHCDSSQDDVTCKTFQSQIVVYSSNRDIVNEDLTSKIRQAFETFDILVVNQDGVVSVEEEDILPNGASGDKTVRSISDNGGMIGLLVGVIALSLSVIVAIICTCRGKRRTQKRLATARQRRSSMEENSVEYSGSDGSKYESEIKPFPMSDCSISTVTTISTPPRSLNEEDEGEKTLKQCTQDETIPQNDAWTSEEALFWLNHPVGPDGEVQQECSAATCRLCEVRRQQGIQVVHPARSTVARVSVTNYKTRQPFPCNAIKSTTSRSPAYEDSARFYMFDDIVDL